MLYEAQENIKNRGLLMSARNWMTFNTIGLDLASRRAQVSGERSVSRLNKRSRDET